MDQCSTVLVFGGVPLIRVGRIVGVIAEVLATGYHTLTGILFIVEHIDRPVFGISSGCVETLVL